MYNEKEIIDGCRKGKRQAQKALYERYKPVMFAVCLRYACDYSEADDILHDGFIRMFSNISQYNETGSFEGWIKRIIINTALSHIRNNKKHKGLYNIDEINERKISEDNDEIDFETTDVRSAITKADFSKDDIFKIVENMPQGYKMVFNLFAIEGFKHKEIALMLGIDINTSKSQLARARKMIQKHLYLLLQQRNNNKIWTKI